MIYFKFENGNFHNKFEKKPDVIIEINDKLILEIMLEIRVIDLSLSHSQYDTNIN